MAIEIWAQCGRVDSEIVKRDVNIIGDFIIPCPFCHVPCTGIYRFWYVADTGQLQLVQVDQSTFDELMEALFNQLKKQGNEDILPTFIYQYIYNDDKGWCSCDAPCTGTIIDKDDFMSTLRMIQQLLTHSAHIKTLLANLVNLVEVADALGKKIWVVDD